MKKVLFYYSFVGGQYTLVLGTAHLYLKTYIETTNPQVGQQIQWLQPQQTTILDEDLIDLCNSQKIDFLCTSHYIWNNSDLMQQLARVRPHLNSNIQIISGGPSISVNIDPDFFTKYPFIDYAIYGPGEKAFCDLMEFLTGGKKSLFVQFTSNLAWTDKKKQKTHVAPYQYVRMLQTSPFLHNREIFLDMVKREKSSAVHLVLPYDLVRGCPYACTFCDWNSGLGNKVSRRKETYKEEIDLFHEADIQVIYLSDANVGQYEEDIDMVKYFAEKNLSQGTNFKLMGNFSKLRKDNNLKIYHVMAQSRLLNQGFTISCQDTHKEILDNIDRPDISWEEHAKMIDELTSCYPHIPCQVQLIQGLPGQTPTTWRETLSLVAKHQTVLMTFLNELLAASPASYNSDYQTKFQYVYSQSERFMGVDMSKEQKFFRGNFSQSCVSFNREDFIMMTILSHIYTMLCGMKFHLRQFGQSWDIEKIVDRFLTSKFYTLLYKNLDDNWKDDKFYYTVDIDGTPKLLSADSGYESAYVWIKNKKIQSFVAECVEDQNLSKAILSYHWGKVRYFDNVGYT